jgi:hypothetical protein
MRNDMVTAVVGLDGTYGFGGAASKALTDHFSYAPQRMFASLLDLRRPAQDSTLDLAALDSFHYSDRTLMTISRMHHSDFGTFAAIAREFDLGNSPGYVDQFQWTRETGFAGFQNTFRLVRDFLDAKLKGDANALPRLLADAKQAQAGTLRHQEAVQPAPSSEDLVAIAGRDGFEAATSMIERYRAVVPLPWIVDEHALNSLGYARIAARQFADGILAFRLNAYAHPGSANLLDSLGDGYAAAGDKANAVASFRRAIEVVESDPAFDAEGKKQFAKDEQTKIRQIGGERR